MRYLFLAVTLLNIGQTAEPPTDFAFRFTRTCPDEMIDTFGGTYSRNADDSKVATSLALSPEERKLIFDAIKASRFFEYPSILQRPRGTVEGVFGPVDRYELEVQSGGQRHRVSWQDFRAPYTPEENRLRELFRRITDVVRAHPKVQRLPEFFCCCL